MYVEKGESRILVFVFMGVNGDWRPYSDLVVVQKMDRGFQKNCLINAEITPNSSGALKNFLSSLRIMSVVSRLIALSMKRCSGNTHLTDCCR